MYYSNCSHLKLPVGHVQGVEMLDQTFLKISISLLHGYFHTVMDLMGYFVELSGRQFDVSISI